MVVNNYLDEGRPHKEVIEIALGFIRKLLQWWNNCLTEESKEDIKCAIQKDEEGLPIFEDPPRSGIPDGVNTLIYTIMKHFVGKPSNITSRIYKKLSNLRCKTLGDYRWYEDVFTTRVMHRSDCNSPFWKENPLGVIDYDNLTYGDISSTIRSEGMKMCRDLKIQSQVNKNKAKYEIGHFYTQYGLPSVNPSKRKSKYRGKESSHRKKTKSKYYRKQKYKTGHFRKECRAKAKSLINTLVSDQSSKNEIFKLFGLDHSDSESSSGSSDQEIQQLYQTSYETSRDSSNTSSSPDEPIPCKDSCCRNKTINVLTKQEELLLDLIEAIEDPVIKAQKLSQFHQTLIKETSKPELRIQQPKVDLEKIYNRFTKSKNEVMVNDLQKEAKEIKSEIRTLKQELTILRNPSDEEVDESVNLTADMAQEPSSEKFLDTITRINFQKWHSKVRIIISKDFEFEVIALIDSVADLNCIQEGIIPSKYFKKTTERLTSASGEKMQIEFKLPKAHVCQDNICFKITFVLVKNMADRKEILSIVLCISKFQSDLLNQKFLIKIDCKSAKHVLGKDVQNIASKQIFARWQAILSVFDFDLEFIEGSQNNILDFLTREFLQSHSQDVREETQEPFGPIQSQKPSFRLTNKGRSPSPYHGSLAPRMALPPKTPEKNITFYKSILIQEQSAKIENIFNRGNPSEVLYHKFIITGFVSCKDWGRHPSWLRTLTNLKSLTGSELHYSYYDYMDTFEKVLFYQNKNYDHSWFLMFDKKFFGQIPSWFLKWVGNVWIHSSDFPRTFIGCPQVF
ncbi:hypothetical protein ACB092_02G123500 [Castanea dentata]